MPQLVICHKCGVVLYEGIELKPPYEIIEKYEGKCPTCAKKLSYIPKSFEVKHVDETELVHLNLKRKDRQRLRVEIE